MAPDVRQERSTGSAGTAAEETATWAGPRWLWFGVLGGGLAWGVHLLVGWSSVELACAQGKAEFLTLRLDAVVWLAVLVPAAVAAVALVVAARAFVVLRRAEQSPPSGVPPRRIGRARFLAEIGIWVDALSLLMIAFGGIASLTFSPCAR